MSPVMLHYGALCNNFIQSRAPGVKTNNIQFRARTNGSPGEPGPGRGAALISHGVNTLNSLLGNEIKQT